MNRLFRPALTALCVLSVTSISPALATERSPVCGVPSELVRLDRPLPRTAQRLLTHEPLKIVAIGSSSTAGAGASSPAASYPNRLAAELSSQYPGTTITIVNRGINGQDAADIVARLQADVIDENADLVIWQLGTNAALRNVPLDSVGSLIATGIDRIKAAGADVVLVDPQFVPRVIAKPESEGMVDLIAKRGVMHKVGVFRRFAIMRHWREVSGLPFEAFTSPDGLHMNDCVLPRRRRRQARVAPA
jgi:acyl-CoA thioesterase I